MPRTHLHLFVHTDRDTSDDEAEASEPDERTKLLPPSGISSNEYYDRSFHSRGARSSHHNISGDGTGDFGQTVRMDNTTASSLTDSLVCSLLGYVCLLARLAVVTYSRVHSLNLVFPS